MNKLINRECTRKRIAIVMALLITLSVLSDPVLQVRAGNDEVTVRVVDEAGQPVAGADVSYKIVSKNMGTVTGGDSVSNGNAGDSISGGNAGGGVSGGDGNVPPLEISGNAITDAEGKIIIELPDYTEGMTISLDISKEGFGRRMIPEQSMVKGKDIEVLLRRVPELQALDSVYNGEERTLVSVSGNIQADDKILYSPDGSDWQEEAPRGKAAGDYSVYVRILREEYDVFESKELTAVIRKAILDNVGAAPYREEYDGTEHPAISFSKLEDGDRVTCTFLKDGADTEISFVYGGEDTVEVPMIQNAGEYSVKVRVERDNYEIYEETFEAVITPVSIEGLTAFLYSGLVYNGQEQELLKKIEGLAPDDRVFFTLDDSEDWLELTDEQRPQACNAGSYKVRIKVQRDNYIDTEIFLSPAEASIRKMEPTLEFVEEYLEDIVYFNTRGDDDNTYQFAVRCDALRAQEIIYRVENVAQGDDTDIADIASIADDGELTITQGGHIVRITASTAGDENHESVSIAHVLAIQSTDDDLIGFEENEVKFRFGTKDIISEQAAEKSNKDDNGAIKYAGKATGFVGSLEEIGIELDSSSGQVSIISMELLSNALGTESNLSVVITAMKEEGTKEYEGGTLTVYAECQTNYTIILSTEEIPNQAYTKYNPKGEEILPDDLVNGWYNTAVTVIPADGYSIARDKVSAPYDNSVVFGYSEADQGIKSRVIYLRNNETNGITAPIIIDLERLDTERPYNMQIDFPEPDEHTQDGVKYYDGEIDIIFTVNDDTSGVETFEWSYARSGDFDSVLEADGGILQAVRDETDETKYMATLTLPVQEAEQLRGYLEVFATDIAGNKSETLTDKGMFVVDTISPYQSVRYGLTDESGTYQTVGTKHYFSGAVEFVFDITETNFIPEDVHITVSKDGGQAQEQPVIWKITDVSDEHEAALTLSGDGDYIVCMTYTDRSGHEMPSYESETIVIDTTAPVIEFSYADYRGETPQMATVTVTEHNFRQSEIVVKADAKTIADQDVLAEDLQSHLRSCQWVHEGDVHTAYLSDQFVDAIYVLTCNYNDMALNRATEVTTEQFVVDHTPPSAERMSVSYSSSVGDTILSAITLGFYNPTVTITFTAYDDTAGVDYFTWNYTRQEGVSAENVELYGDTRIEAVQDTVDKAKFVASITLPRAQAQQLRGSIAFTATDRYGNVSDKLTDSGNVIVVDTISPVMTAEYTSPDNTFGNKLYYNKTLTATFTVTEANFFSEDIVVMLTRNDEDAVRITPVWTDVSADMHVGTYVIDASNNHANDGDYVFTINYTDRSNNVMSTYTSDIFVIDTTIPVFSIEYSNQSVVNTLTDNQGISRRYFSDELRATLTIVEHNFDQNQVNYIITASDVAGNMLNAEALYTNTVWTSDGDTHTATIVYPGDANYSFDIEYMDLALHEMGDYVTEFFTVDKSMPEGLDISYSTSILDTILANISFGFYSTQTTVRVTATDRISGVYGFDYSYLLAEGVSLVNGELAEQIIDEAQITFSDGGATATASFPIPLATPGAVNQFNGTVNFSATDRAGNKTDYLQDVKRIVVDNIAPTANVEYNAPVQEINNISYYDGDINAMVTINEANFYPEDVMVSVTRDGAEYAVTPVWSENGADMHMGTFTLTDDGDYLVNITYSDKSGNIMQQYASEQMTIDTEIEEAVITVNGIEADGKAFKDEVVLAVSFEDTNFEDYEILLTRTNFASKNIDVTEQFIGERITTSNFGGSGSFDTFSRIAENDGIYTVIVRLSDKAGHTVEKTATFTVNRYGSVYEYSDYLVDLIRDGGAYVQRVEDDLLITEYNADRLVSQSLNIEISRDGKPLDDYDYRVTPEINDVATVGDKGWYQYQYTILKENFIADGVYKIAVSSRDQTGNTPENTNYDDMAILFRVDSTPPEINSITGLESGIVNATNLEVKYTVYDTIGLASVTMYVDGEEMDSTTDFSGDEQNFSGNLLLEESPQAQRVRLVVRDLAGNVTDTDAENFISAFAFNSSVTISTNAVVRWYANKPLFWGSIGGMTAIVGAGAGGAVLLGRKKKRKAKA